jgi:hypothetical protein
MAITRNRALNGQGYRNRGQPYREPIFSQTSTIQAALFRQAI